MKCLSKLVTASIPVSLLIIVVFTPDTTFAIHLAMDKAGETMIVEDKEEPSGQTSSSGIESKKDLLSENTLQNDGLRRTHYIDVVNEGVEYAQQGQYAQAIDKYEMAVKIDPNLSYAYINLANAYCHLKKYDESIVMSKKALQIDPQDARAYGNLGNAYHCLDKQKEADNNYQKAKQLFQEAGDLEGLQKIEESISINNTKTMNKD